MIEVNGWLRAELIRRAEREAPLEACGLISEPRDLDSAPYPHPCLWRAENVSQEPTTTFLISPPQQTELLGEIWKMGHDLVGIYHSHPRSEPEPSEADRILAERIQSMRPVQAAPLTWVIVSLVEPASLWVDELP